jgi:hypothetical protein
MLTGIMIAIRVKILRASHAWKSIRAVQPTRHHDETSRLLSAGGFVFYRVSALANSPKIADRRYTAER